MSAVVMEVLLIQRFSLHLANTHALWPLGLSSSVTLCCHRILSKSRWIFNQSFNQRICSYGTEFVWIHSDISAYKMSYDTIKGHIVLALNHSLQRDSALRTEFVCSITNVYKSSSLTFLLMGTI